MVLNPGVDGIRPGQPFAEAIGMEPDVVFDIAVEANRPDAWCMAGVARDLAARLRPPLRHPRTGAAAAPSGRIGGGAGPRSGWRTTELCPRFTARVITGVTVGPSPAGSPARLTLAGMRPINNVVDASNYVMLELGQPTHPYDLDRLGGAGLLIRSGRQGGDRHHPGRGRPGCSGNRAPVSGETGEDCLICDAEGNPVGIAGMMGGASSEIGAAPAGCCSRLPISIRWRSPGPRSGWDCVPRRRRGSSGAAIPSGIDRAADRLFELLALTAGSAAVVAPGTIDVRGDVPTPVELTVRPNRVSELLGKEFTGAEIAALLTPIGITTVEAPATAGPAPPAPPRHWRSRSPPSGPTSARPPTARPTSPRKSPASTATPSCRGGCRPGPRPDASPVYQRDRRKLKDVLGGLGATETWTTTFVSELDQTLSGVAPPYIEVTNPLVESERYLRTSMVPGLVPGGRLQRRASPGGPPALRGGDGVPLSRNPARFRGCVARPTCPSACVRCSARWGMTPGPRWPPGGPSPTGWPSPTGT